MEKHRNIRSASVKKIAASSRGVKIWALDFPAHDRLIDFSENYLQIQGWVLFDQPSVNIPEVVVVADGEILYTGTFSSKRPDVIERVLGQPAQGHPQLNCGFNVKVVVGNIFNNLKLGFKVEGVVEWLAEVKFVAPLQVLEGKNGWLFLDNDTNQSIDQYTGKRLLNSEELRYWYDYLDGLDKLAQSNEIDYAFLIAPSKEEVLRHLHPYVRAELTVLDQICTLTKPEWNLLNAAKILNDYVFPENCFKKTDTHWTDRGAMLAVLGVLPMLRVASNLGENIFSKDVYEYRNEVGDLGAKMLPQRMSSTEFLVDSKEPNLIVFDNGLPNIGRTLIFKNSHAPIKRRLLMFGASSGYPMLKYLKRIFERIVFVHSAAQVDLAVVVHEKPDALLLQSNGRFLVQAPSLTFSLRNAVYTKLSESTAAVKKNARELLRNELNDKENNFYRHMLESGV